MAKPFDPSLEIADIAALLPAYRQVEVLVEGGQGCVFRATRLDGLLVAIKVYSPDQSVIRAELEVQKLKSVSSPFLVELLEYGYTRVRGRDCFYSVTKFEKGEDLRRHLNRNGPLTESRIQALICNICEAIDSLWRVRVVHCDIKPENILLGEDELFRLVDLGLAKHLDIQRRITPTGLILGTPGYVAPEQMQGRKNLTLRADLFALGIVAYESLTGEHPFQWNQFLIASRVYPQLPSASTSVSDRVERVITNLMEFNPLYRPASGREVIAMIRGD